jgi:D-amino-acid dehydrogenase
MTQPKHTSSKHILIVGGGILGLCTAYYAMQKGHRITIVERGGPAHDGCSLGNAGMIVPSHFVPLAAPGMVGYGLRMMLHPESPFYVRPRLSLDLIRWGLLFARSATEAHVARAAPLLRDLNLASRRCYEDFAAEFGDIFGLTRRGLLMLCKSEQSLHEEALMAQRACELGLPAEVLSPGEAARLDPGVTMEIAGAVHFPQDCHLTPQVFVARLTEALVAGGVEIAWETEVISWRTEGGQIAGVETSWGEMCADEYVLAGGSWSPQTVRGLGLRLPMQAGKGYSVTLPQPRQMPQLCSIFTEARVAVTPMGESLRFGGTMEITGLDSSVSRSRVDGILKAIPRYFPNFTSEDFRDLPVWSGLRPCSPDGLPYVGRFGRYANLSAATGHAMMGMSLGPITGKLLAELLSGERPEISLDALSPNRFG